MTNPLGVGGTRSGKVKKSLFAVKWISQVRESPERDAITKHAA